MSSITTKRFCRNYQPIADAISRAEIGQVEREALAESVADAIDGIVHDTSHGRPAIAKNETGWSRSLFAGIARDPMVPCPGYHLDDGSEVRCPHGREIRIAMHLSSAPDGRSAAWSPTMPEMRCVSCGAREFVPGYPKEVTA